MEDDILAADSGSQLTIDLDLHVLAALGDERLCSENMLNLTGTDAESKRAKCTVSGGVTVAAYDGGTRQGETLLGADDVDNSLSLVVESEECEVEVLDVLFQSSALCSRVGIINER